MINHVHSYPVPSKHYKSGGVSFSVNSTLKIPAFDFCEKSEKSASNTIYHPKGLSVVKQNLFVKKDTAVRNDIGSCL